MEALLLASHLTEVDILAIGLYFPLLEPAIIDREI
jgi:hypothetical protein